MVDFIYEVGVEIGGAEGNLLMEHCSAEDDSRLAYESMHNGIILCLLDEELGIRKPISTAEQDSKILRKKQSEDEEAERKKYELMEKEKFDNIFRKGLMGLVVESLELDSWFKSS